MVDVRQEAITLVSGGMKQCEAARVLGVHPQTLSRWVRGEAAKSAGVASLRSGKWSKATYLMAQSLYDEGVTITQIADRLGVPSATIRYWASGTPAEPWGWDRASRKGRRTQSLRQYYRREHRFHVVHNPNYELAPLHHLWLPRADVLAHITRCCPCAAVRLDGRTEDRLYDRMKAAGAVGWARFDSVDKIFSVLDLLIHDLGEPVYCTHSVGPHYEEKAA